MTMTSKSPKSVMINLFPDHQPAFKLWVKFKEPRNGNDTGVFYSRETWFTQSQIQYRAPLLMLEYKKSYELLIRLLEVNLHGKHSMARIYYTNGNQILREYQNGRLTLKGDPDMDFWTNELPDSGAFNNK